MPVEHLGALGFMDLGKSGLEVCISLGMVTETMIVEFTWDRWGAEHSGKNTVGVKSLLHQRGASALISFSGLTDRSAGLRVQRASLWRNLKVWAGARIATDR